MLVNLTPHKIVLALPDGTRKTILPSGQTARIIQDGVSPLERREGLPVRVKRVITRSRVVGLPRPEKGTIYLVSVVVLMHPDVAGRRDVYAPDSGPGAVRDSRGKLSAVTTLLTTAA